MPVPEGRGVERGSRDDALDADDLLAVVRVALQDDLVVEDALAGDLVDHPGHSALVDVPEGELEPGQPIGYRGVAPLIRVALHALQVEVGLLGLSRGQSDVHLHPFLGAVDLVASCGGRGRRRKRGLVNEFS